ncbi:uncharacterized protein L3040_001897 [Drepanopeziza brunnea f. sp. 'multigermtubi']|uniref:RecA family profile 1 domain-containing protein n=1 Tax=Marssonina brunnea f. sp. multigermtubi (strain MB_m1) TaxID=1072389 RepID=K1X413_MARBU|nr:uncharacterized protein MBM_01709 [Drepanopeziza brunnea f. sp. 'multigermtubi' MB_m1]EKD19757.1 hypothetical protein MBM_01709 [Drepanopeziza brunnea f. sp. 'multigermtubi' MB_m1]KAJ5052138.1 hypothetical protein L3040_001897 [Drepanopeziza brunnea f. sp. 'multigermtubi']
MDYNSIHGPGASNFSSPSAHRMPTVSAAQAFQDLRSSPTRCISTGLFSLDCVLQNIDQAFTDVDSAFGGVSRGKVTEIYGPPGVGKTALCMQLAASALHAGGGVVWVDASHPVSGPRLSQVLTSHHSPSSQPPTLSSLLTNLTHFTVPSLAHLLALLCHPAPNNPPQSTSLIIIDSFSTLITNAFPRNADAKPKTTPKKPGAFNPSARKFSILQHLISSLSKLATTRNIAIVLTSQCVSKMRSGAGAVLAPAITATAWEQGLGCRVKMMRDWGWEDEEGKAINDVRLVRVLKAEGVAVARAKMIGVGIGEYGIYHLPLPTKLVAQATQPQDSSSSPLKHPHSSLPPHLAHHVGNVNNNNTNTTPLPHPSQKRKLSATDLEIPDSDLEDEDDEDYGWAESDEEELPPPPPQWQGSEDALAPPVEEEEEHGDEELLELAAAAAAAGVGEEEEEQGLEEGEKEVAAAAAARLDSGGGCGDGDGDATQRRRRKRIQRDEIDDSEDELA